MQPIIELRRIYGEYLAEAERKASFSKSEVIPGFGRGPESDPDYERFTERLGSAVKAVAESAPTSSDVAETLRYIYDMPLNYKGNTLVYFMLSAVHSMTDSLVRLLEPEDAAALCARYEEAYPKSERLPAQKKILTLLKAQLEKALPHQKSKPFGFLRWHGR